MERGVFLNELIRLETELKISLGRGKLIIFAVNEPYMRDLVLNFLNSKFKTKKIIVTKGEQISRAIKERDSDFDVLVWQLPETVNSEILNALNYKREIFYETDFPHVVICNGKVLNDLIRDAPDFWRYRASSHVIEKSIPAIQNIVDLGHESHFEGENLEKQIEINDYLLKESKRDNQRAYLLSQRAKFYTALRKYGEALRYYDGSLEMSEKIGDYRSIAEVYSEIATIHEMRG